MSDREDRERDDEREREERDRSRSRSHSRSRSRDRGGDRSADRNGSGGKRLKGEAVRWHERGFGFIKPDDGGEDVFCHISAIRDGNMLKEGGVVEYELKYDERRGKPRAENVTGGYYGDDRGPPPKRRDRDDRRRSRSRDRRRSRSRERYDDRHRSRDRHERRRSYSRDRR